MPHSKNSFAKRCWTPNRRRVIRVCVFWLCLFKSKTSWAQKSLNWVQKVQKVVWDCLGFALLYFVLVLTLDAATKFIMIWSFTISNALGNSMFCLVFYWRSVLNEAFISFCFNFYVSFFLKWIHGTLERESACLLEVLLRAFLSSLLNWLLVMFSLKLIGCDYCGLV